MTASAGAPECRPTATAAPRVEYSNYYKGKKKVTARRDEDERKKNTPEGGTKVTIRYASKVK